MSRPIKFRAYADEKMVRVRAMSFDDKGDALHIMDEEGVQRVPDSLMQFTGFLDKKRREVYEGDIIAVNANAATVMRWQEYRWYPQLPKKTLFEVIGNVHENPELVAKIKDPGHG